MERKFRLTRSTEFLRVRRCGKSYAHPLVVLIVQESTPNSLQIGISASHSIGNAVQRNRAKRRIRACFHELLPSLRRGFDLVVLARKPIGQARYSEICAGVSQLLKKADLLEVKIDGC